MGRQMPGKPVRTVERTLSILFHVAHSGRPVSLSEISAATSVDKATALRLLATLEGFNLVSRNPDSLGYLVGPAALQLANAMQGSLRDIALPHLNMLRDLTDESASLVVQRALERVSLISVEARHELRIVPNLNNSPPIYSGASGLVFMAFMPAAESARIIEMTGLAPVNERAISQPERYRKEMRAVRRRGYAVTRGDVTPGAAAVAAPVLDGNGSPLAVLSLRGPEVRMGQSRIDELAPLVVDAARRISDDLVGAGRSMRSDGEASE